MCGVDIAKDGVAGRAWAPEDYGETEGKSSTSPRPVGGGAAHMRSRQHKDSMGSTRDVPFVFSAIYS